MDAEAIETGRTPETRWEERGSEVRGEKAQSQGRKGRRKSVLTRKPTEKR